MQYIGLIPLILFTIIFLLIAKKSYYDVKTARDFLTYGEFLNKEVLKRTFQATNASFAMAFVSLFLYGKSYGMIAFAVPIGFILGIFFYVYIILPRHITLFKDNMRLPRYIEYITGSKALKIFTSIFLIISLWLFTFAELQGFNIVIRESFGFGILSKMLVPLVVVVVLALYTAYGGFRAVLLTDKMQMLVIMFGTIVLYVAFGAIFINNSHDFYVNALNISAFAGSYVAIILFILEVVVGFLFSQLLYFDNWQRLSFYVYESSVKGGHDLEEIEKTIRKQYLGGAAVLLVVYAAPILLAIATPLSNGTNEGFSVGNLVTSIWGLHPVWGPILVSIIIVNFGAALISTADTNVVGSVNVVLEDLLNIDIMNDSRESLLLLARSSAILFCGTLLFVSYIQPNFQTFFFFLFYSVNGFVGPLFFGVFGLKVSPRATTIAVVTAFTYALLSLTVMPFLYYPGLATVIISFLISSFGIKKRGDLAIISKEVDR